MKGRNWEKKSGEVEQAEWPRQLAYIDGFVESFFDKSIRVRKGWDWRCLDR